MNEDIKEMFDRYKKYFDDDYALAYVDEVISLKDIKNIYNYITNLQEENKQLKETNEEHRKINGDLRKENQELVKVIEELETMLKEYKKRLMNEKYTTLESKGLVNGQLFAYGLCLDKLTELKGE